MKYILGIDGGSQSTKMAIYDTDGNIMNSTAVPLKQMILSPGGKVEHPDDDLWDSLCAAARILLKDFKGNLSELCGVGLCTIRFCRCLLKKDGTLSQPAMSWMDARVAKPYVHDNPDTAYVTTSSGYITKRLTGENKDTAANCLGAWPMDLDTWDWDPNRVEAFGTGREMLFDLVKPGDLLGYVTREAAASTGIPEGLPVFATANDKAVEALGVGCIDKGHLLISLGTYIAAMSYADTNQGDNEVGWTNLACIPGRYFFETNGIRRGMWMLSWWAGVVGEDYAARAAKEGLPPEALLNREAEKVPAGSDGLMVIPQWLAPVEEPYRKGMMLGFDGRHGRGHIYRAILEGIAMTMKERIECAGVPVRELYISGGGTKSDVFMQIFSDVFRVPVHIPGVNGSAGLGSAVCAAVGLGIWPDFDTAVHRMTREGRCFLPKEENAGVYEKLYPVYKDAADIGVPLFKRSYPVVG